MKGWKEKLFNDFIKLNRGFDLPNEKLVEGKFPVVTSTEIKAFHKDFKVKGPGVVTGRSGSLGTVQFVEGDYWPHNTTLYVKDFKGNDHKFVYYFLQTMHLENFNSGAGVPTLNQNHLHKQKLIIPDVKLQYLIASILSAYDDLIEVNNQRIKILEETARQLYKEWFVRMRFPCYKKAKFVKGVPVGWEVKKVADAFEILGGGTPSTENDTYWNGNVNWYSPTDITASKGIYLSESSHRITEKGLKESSARLFPAYSIMMTSRATIGAVGINTTPACTNQGFITCLPNNTIPFTFLYYWILTNKEVFETFGTGSTFLEITKGTFKKINILIPKNDIMEKFHQIVEPIFKQMENLQEQNTQLRQIRDRLLPRLVSGKLQVKEK